jgi:hypothetical protein
VHRTVDTFDTGWMTPEFELWHKITRKGIFITGTRRRRRNCTGPDASQNCSSLLWTRKWSESAATFVLVSGSLRDFLSRACSPYRIRIDWYVLFLKGALCGFCCPPTTHHGLLRVFFRRNTVVSTALPGCFSFSHSLGMLHPLPRIWYWRVT